MRRLSEDNPHGPSPLGLEMSCRMRPHEKRPSLPDTSQGMGVGVVGRESSSTVRAGHRLPAPHGPSPTDTGIARIPGAPPRCGTRRHRHADAGGGYPQLRVVEDLLRLLPHLLFFVGVAGVHEAVYLRVSGYRRSVPGLTSGGRCGQHQPDVADCSRRSATRDAPGTRGTDW